MAIEKQIGVLVCEQDFWITYGNPNDIQIRQQVKQSLIEVLAAMGYVADCSDVNNPKIKALSKSVDPNQIASAICKAQAFLKNPPSIYSSDDINTINIALSDIVKTLSDLGYIVDARNCKAVKYIAPYAVSGVNYATLSNPINLGGTNPNPNPNPNGTGEGHTSHMPKQNTNNAPNVVAFRLTNIRTNKSPLSSVVAPVTIPPMGGAVIFRSATDAQVSVADFMGNVTTISQHNGIYSIPNIQGVTNIVSLLPSEEQIQVFPTTQAGFTVFSIIPTPPQTGGGGSGGVRTVAPVVAPTQSAYIYSINPDNITIISGGFVPFTGSTVVGSISIIGGTTISVLVAGTYDITYNITVAAGTAPLKYALFVNGADDATSIYEIPSSIGQVVGRATIVLPANSTIKLENKSSGSVTTQGGNVVDASISLTKVA